MNTNQKIIRLNRKQVEIDALSAQETVELLKNNQANITDFTYYKGTINDAFLQITGKEIQ